MTWLGTLDDSIVDLYDTTGRFWTLTTTTGTPMHRASIGKLPVPASATFSWGAYTSSQGTYTLTVSLIIDDHANSEGGATAIRAGAGVRGVLDYDGDIDYFRFQAEQGNFYQMTWPWERWMTRSLCCWVPTTGNWLTTTTTGIPMHRASLGKLPVLASATLRWRATA